VKCIVWDRVVKITQATHSLTYTRTHTQLVRRFTRKVLSWSVPFDEKALAAMVPAPKNKKTETRYFIQYTHTHLLTYTHTYIHSLTLTYTHTYLHSLT
jgi:hypothetical protein